jgi:hypothetical protein
MRYKVIAGLPALLLLFGCVHTQPDSSAPAPTKSGTQQDPNSVQGTQKATPDKTEPHPTQPQAPAAVPSSPSAAQGKDATKAPPRSTGTSPEGATAAPSSGTSSKPSSPRNSSTVPGASTAPGTSSAAAGKTNNATTTTQPPVKTPATTSAPPAAASLDLASLQTRLKDTRAIGLFTKLSLKNQVDDLLSQFRAFYSKKAAIPLSDLRQRYDLLLIKVLSLLQDGDPDLAAAISSSREAIWGVLADPEKFAKL